MSTDYEQTTLYLVRLSVHTNICPGGRRVEVHECEQGCEAAAESALAMLGREKRLSDDPSSPPVRVAAQLAEAQQLNRRLVDALNKVGDLLLPDRPNPEWASPEGTAALLSAIRSLISMGHPNAERSVVQINAEALTSIARMVWTSDHIPPDTPPERIKPPYPHEIVTRVGDIVGTLIAMSALARGLERFPQSGPLRAEILDDLNGCVDAVRVLINDSGKGALLGQVVALGERLLGSDALFEDPDALIGAIERHVTDLSARGGDGEAVRRSTLTAVALELLPTAGESKSLASAEVVQFRVETARRLLERSMEAG